MADRAAELVKRLDAVELAGFEETSDHEGFRALVLGASVGVIDGRRWCTDKLSVMLTVDVEGPFLHASVVRRSGKPASDQETRRVLGAFGMSKAKERPPGLRGAPTRHFVLEDDDA